MALKINGDKAAPAKATVTELKPSNSATSLKAIMGAIAKEKGDKLITKGSVVPKVKRLPTGVFEFDLATGGGFPCARYSIVYGPESSGKTNICYCAAAQAQRLPPPCNKVVWIDVEGTFDAEWAAMFGIDIEELIVVRPGYGEEAIDMVDALIRADDVALLVVDSLAPMIGIKEIQQSMEKFDVGTQPLLIKRMVNKLVNALSDEEKKGHTPAVVLINQTRMEIGKMFGNPEKMPGGKAMLFLSCLTVRVSGTNKVVATVNPNLPAFKETDARIIKSKVRVNQSKFSYDLCMLPHDGLGVGETDSWNTVSGHLKSLGLLKKADKGQEWSLDGFKYPTLLYFKDKYASEPAWAVKCQKMVVDSQKGFFVELKVEEPVPDTPS